MKTIYIRYYVKCLPHSRNKSKKYMGCRKGQGVMLINLPEPDSHSPLLLPPPPPVHGDERAW